MHNVDTQCTVGGREEAKRQRKKLCLNFCLAIKYKFYFTSTYTAVISLNILTFYHYNMSFCISSEIWHFKVFCV